MGFLDHLEGFIHLAVELSEIIKNRLIVFVKHELEEHLAHWEVNRRKVKQSLAHYLPQEVVPLQLLVAVLFLHFEVVAGLLHAGELLEQAIIAADKVLDEQGQPFSLDTPGILSFFPFKEYLKFLVQVQVNEGLEGVEALLNKVFPINDEDFSIIDIRHPLLAQIPLKPEFFLFQA